MCDVFDKVKYKLDDILLKYKVRSVIFALILSKLL